MGQILAAACFVIGLAGCGSGSTSSHGGGGGRTRATPQQRAELLVGTMDTLFRLEAYEFGQAEELVMSRLNQWLRGEDLKTSWQREPHLAGLPPRWQNLPGIASLSDDSFLYDHDFAFLREAVWMHRIADHVRAEMERDASAQTARSDQDARKTSARHADPVNFVSDDDPPALRLAMRLFDWTVKNIQLEDDAWPETTYRLPPQWHTPYETVLLGRGTASDRAWVFILLARQLGLDVVMLGLGDAQSGAELKPWLPALVVSHGQADERAPELFLFDPALGLPIPAADRRGIATLAQAAEDESVLGQLALDEKRPYAVTMTDLQQVTALVEASPGYLSRRAKFLESKLAGHQRIVLTVAPQSIEQKISGARHLRAGIELWPRPFETYEVRSSASRQLVSAAATELYPLEGLTRRMDESAAQRKVITRREESPEWVDPEQKRGSRARIRVPLGVGRMLQLAGNYHHETGALRYLQQAMASEADQDDVMQMFLEMEPGANEVRRQQIAQRAKDVVRELRRSDQAAKLWIGQIKAEQGEYETAITYFTRENPVWRGAIDYSLARLYEAKGDLPKAIQTYRESESPQRHGNLLRARRLEKLLEQAANDS